MQAVYRKVRLPNYGVFDELRYFQRGEGAAVLEVDGDHRRADDLRGHLAPGRRWRTRRWPAPG